MRQTPKQRRTSARRIKLRQHFGLYKMPKLSDLLVPVIFRTVGEISKDFDGFTQAQLQEAMQKFMKSSAPLPVSFEGAKIDNSIDLGIPNDLDYLNTDFKIRTNFKLDFGNNVNLNSPD